MLISDLHDIETILSSIESISDIKDIAYMKDVLVFFNELHNTC